MAGVLKSAGLQSCNEDMIDMLSHGQLILDAVGMAVEEFHNPGMSR